MLSTGVKSVLDIQRKRLQRETDLKNKIVMNIRDRIKSYALYGQMRCIYTIPEFIFGNAPYNIMEMTAHIIKQLDNEGYYIQLFDNNKILVSWDIHDIKKCQKRKEKAKRNYDDLRPLMSK